MPCFYGAFERHGRSALAFEYGGVSLAHQGLKLALSSLPLLQRLRYIILSERKVVNGAHDELERREGQESRCPSQSHTHLRTTFLYKEKE